MSLYQFTNTYLTVHQTPSSFLHATRGHLDVHQRKLNVILPHALKLAAQEKAYGVQSLAAGQLWICGWSSNRELEYILSCTEHHLGTYPLFLVHLRPIPSLSPKSLSDEMLKLARKMLDEVPSTRVFSIYGQEIPTRMLCEHWSRISGHRIVRSPYYEASSSYITRNTFVGRGAYQQDRAVRTLPLIPFGHEMRLATEDDIKAVAQLCMEFAEDSPPFLLSLQGATEEAKYMIKHRLVWVYTIDRIVTTLVAVTRSSGQVAGMTKVYTAPRFRGRGCAEKLVSFVCEQLLFGSRGPTSSSSSSPAPSSSSSSLPPSSPAARPPFDSVVLFVGHTLAAARVYHRVGFMGVGPGKQFALGEDGKAREVYMPDAERWLELGFEDTDIGHW